MEDYEKNEIPFGANDSELCGFEYTIPQGYEAEIKDGKVIIRKKESDDEKIRKGLINGFKFYSDQEYWGTEKFALKIKDILAWLEKQDKNNMGISEATKKKLEDNLNKALEKETPESFNEFLDEQKHAEWSEDDREYMESLLDIINGTPSLTPSEVECHKDWLKSLRPQNWTKEDKERYISCLQRLSTGNPEQPETINSKWFKEHVYSQSTWKPSDEQMDALEKECIAHSNYELCRLLEQLKKLKD